MPKEQIWTEELIDAVCVQNGWQRTGKYMKEKELAFYTEALPQAEALANSTDNPHVVTRVLNEINTLAIKSGLDPLGNEERYFFIGTGEFVKKWKHF